MTVKFFLHRDGETPEEIAERMARVEKITREVDLFIDKIEARTPGIFTDEIVSALVQIILGRILTANPADEREDFADAVRQAFGVTIDVYFGKETEGRETLN
jgi:hypothetical protein